MKPVTRNEIIMYVGQMLLTSELIDRVEGTDLYKQAIKMHCKALQKEFVKLFKEDLAKHFRDHNIGFHAIMKAMEGIAETQADVEDLNDLVDIDIHLKKWNNEKKVNKDSTIV